MKLFLVSIAFYAVIAVGAAPEDGEYKLPESVKTCNENDPNLNECIKDAIQDIIPKLYKGDKELGAPVLDPLIVPKNRFDFNYGGIQGFVEIKGVKMYGLSRAEIKKVDMKISDTGLTTEIEIFLPKLYVDGRYRANVQVNDIKMNPRGFFNVTISSITVTNKMAGIFEKTRGHKYLHLTSYDLIPEVRDMKVYASGLLPDPQLNDVVLGFVNRYWSQIYNLLLPEARVQWEPIFRDSFNKYFLTIPFDKLLTKKQE